MRLGKILDDNQQYCHRGHHRLRHFEPASWVHGVYCRCVLRQRRLILAVHWIQADSRLVGLNVIHSLLTLRLWFLTFSSEKPAGTDCH